MDLGSLAMGGGLFLGAGLIWTAREARRATLFFWGVAAALGVWVHLIGLVQAEAEWVLAALFVGSLGALGERRVAQILGPPVVAMATVALAARMGRLGALGLTSLALAIASALRPRLENRRLVDLWALLAVAAGSAMAAPVLLRGWDRGSVAAEVGAAPGPSWSPAVVAALFVFALARATARGLRCFGRSP
jgi:hypothetical protein